LLGSSIIAVSAGLYFWPHYFIVALPAVSVLIAISVISAFRIAAASEKSSWLRFAPVAIFAAAWFQGIVLNADVYFKSTPFEATRLWYGPNPFPESIPIADYLRQNTGPNDRIMVFGSEPQIYFYAHRKSATGFIYTYSLLEEQAYWQPMQQQLMREVETN